MRDLPHAMHPSRGVVTDLMRCLFPEARWSAVSAHLAAYGIEPHEKERDRVHAAVLRLSGGSEASVRDLIAVAKRDYRDVLALET